MADWVHCNQCFRKPGEASRKFSLTNCGHIFCDDCMQPGTKAECKMCKVTCTTILLSPKMKPEVEVFFTNPLDLAKQLCKVLEFQRNHRQRLMYFTGKKLEKQKSVLSQAQALMDNHREEERERNVLKEENAFLKKLLEKQSTGAARTPPMVPYHRGSSPSSQQPVRPRRLSPSPHRVPPLVSPSDTTRVKAPHGSVYYAAPLAKESPSTVTSGRVRVGTPPAFGKMGGRPGAPSPGTTLNAPVPPQTKMPITPGVTAPSTPMDVSPRHKSIPHSTEREKGLPGPPVYPSRLR